MTSASRLLSTRGPLTPLNRPSGSKNSVQFLLGGRRLDQLLVQSGTRLSNWSTNGREKMCSIAEELHLSRESSLNTGDGWMSWVYVTARKFLLSQFLTRFSAIILEVNFTEPDFLPCAPAGKVKPFSIKPQKSQKPIESSPFDWIELPSGSGSIQTRRLPHIFYHPVMKSSWYSRLRKIHTTSYDTTQPRVLIC